jgi:prepilin-type N-terminal cleavage/methylation domain-containing protein
VNRPRSNPACSGGFTLLETLVTVSIFALLFAVLMGGWYQALKSQSRLADAAQQVQQQQQMSTVLRQLLSELASPRKKELGVVFQGTRRGFVGESTASQAPGLGAAPVPVSLQVEGSSPALRVRVEHPGMGGALYPWKLAVAEFRYVDVSGRAHDTWPPSYSMAEQPAGETPALPALIQLTLQIEGQPLATTILAAPRTTSWPLAEPVSPFQVKPE